MPLFQDQTEPPVSLGDRGDYLKGKTLYKFVQSTLFLQEGVAT
jgi:hypothetical protein